MLTVKEKEDLLVDLRNKFNVVIQNDDPSLVAWYLQSLLLEDLKKSIREIEENRQRDLRMIKELTDNFSLNMDTAVQDATKTILDLSSIKLLEDTEKTRKDANSAVLTGVNIALQKISDSFSSETAKLEQLIKAYTGRVEKESKNRFRNELIILASIVSGAALAIIVATVVYAMKH
jgi:hypothetical protein